MISAIIKMSYGEKKKNILEQSLKGWIVTAVQESLHSKEAQEEQLKVSGFFGFSEQNCFRNFCISKWYSC